MKKKTRKRLQGGSVSHLSSSALQISSGAELKEKMELYYIGCHGQTTPDRIFFTVPANTYILFAAHSGDPAIATERGQESYISHKNLTNPDSYYENMYNQLFKPYKERLESGRPQYEENLYIYEPGDLIPDYSLQFKNVAKFTFMHGIYKLPVQSLSGPNKTGSAYLGQTKVFIKQLLDTGYFKPEDLHELHEKDRDDILTKTLEELEKEGSYFKKPFEHTSLYQKVEEVCCRTNPENILYKPPFDEKIIQEQKHRLRLSYILDTLKPPSGKKRFFFLNFCRVSYSDYMHQYKALLRTASFVGKCPMQEDRSRAFNINAVARHFCALPNSIKKRILSSSEGQHMFRCFKRAILPAKGMQYWSDCIKDVWKIVPIPEGYSRKNIFTQPYEGYLTDEDMIFLSELYPVLSKFVSADKFAGMKLKQAAHLYARSAAILKDFAIPFESLHRQLSKQMKETREEQEQRKAYIKEIYSLINKKITPYKVRGDVLYLESVGLHKLDLLVSRLRENVYDKDLEGLVKDMEGVEEMQSDYLELFLHSIFGFYAGYPPIEGNTLNYKKEKVANVSDYSNAETVENIETLFRSNRKTRKRRV